MKAASRSRWLASGSCNPVMSPSTAASRCPGPIRSRLTPAPARRAVDNREDVPCDVDDRERVPCDVDDRERAPCDVDDRERAPCGSATLPHRGTGPGSGVYQAAPASAAVSSPRTTVVPTATTLPPAARQAAIAATVASGTR